MENIMVFIDLKFDSLVFQVELFQSPLHSGVPVVLNCVVRPPLQALGYLGPLVTKGRVASQACPVLFF